MISQGVPLGFTLCFSRGRFVLRQFDFALHEGFYGHLFFSPSSEDVLVASRGSKNYRRQEYYSRIEHLSSVEGGGRCLRV
ncbi:hypothetical protein R1flu_024842 [Riccia fluitans]|uniref:Uncharacterized protein n=1 Tax=Riccia fluitans TaxID=41844 RepID=A0ABD1XWG5_9MARC